MWCVSSRRRSNISSVSCISCRSMALQLVRYYLLLITLRLLVCPMMHFSVLVAVPLLRSLLYGRMTRISCAGNASSTEGGAAGQNSAALIVAGVSPSRSPGRSSARRKPRLSQPTSGGSRSSRVRYPGVVVEADSGESAHIKHLNNNIFYYFYITIHTFLYIYICVFKHFNYLTL